MPWILLLLALVVTVFGFGVVLLGRLRRGGPGRSPVRPSSATGAPSAPPIAPRPAEAIDQADEVESLLGLDERFGYVSDFDELSDEELAERLADKDVETGEPGSLAEDIDYERPRFRDRLVRARSSLAGAFASVRGRAGVTEQTWEELEEALIVADVGVGLTTELLDELRAQLKRDKVNDPDELLARLKAEMLHRLSGLDRSLRLDLDPGHPDVWLFVGVNGVGKTTTIGKVAAQRRSEGRSVLLAAGDTFRAAAAEQLGMWADRAGAELVRGDEGADPAAIVFDGVERARARGIDLVLADTAGRLHTKSNLMEELRKVRRVAEKGAGVVTEVLLVIDATTGQNGMAQARQFADAVDVTGVVLTKLDGSAKGGIVFAIWHELGLPVKLVGLGETIGDLTEFEPAEFVDALFE